MRKNLLQALACASALGAASQAMAQAESQEPAATAEGQDNDLEFSKKLNDVQLFDYSELYLKKRMAAVPAKGDALKAQLADTYAQWNKFDDAAKIAAQIPEGTALSARAFACIGTAAAKKQNYNLVIQSLEKTLAAAQKDKKILEESRPALLWLRQAYQETGQTEKMKKLVEATSAGQDPRETSLSNVFAQLDTAQSMYDDEVASPERAKPFEQARKDRLSRFDQRENFRNSNNKGELDRLAKPDPKDWQAVVIASICEMEELQWGGPDVISAFSYPMMARAYIMIGRPDAAIAEIEKVPDLMEACDESFKQQKALGQSPGAFAKFWLGEALYKKSTMAAKPEEKLDALKKSFKNFGKLLKEYQGFQDAPKAYNRFVKVCDEISAADPQLASKIEAVKKDVPVPQGGAAAAVEEDIIPPQTDLAFKDKRYADVIKDLMPLVREKRLSSGAPNAVYMLAFSLASTKKDLEAMALCAYLAATAPKSQYTSIALLQVAEVFWKLGTPASKEDAMALYELFLSIAPDHQYACEIAMRVAQEYYNTALNMALSANKMPPGKARQVKTAQAIAAFKKAIPHYQRIIANFSHRKELVDKAYYLLALSFNSAKMFDEAANTYLRFCDSEPEDMTQVADAKLRAADSLFQAGQEYEKQAKELREEAIAMGVETEAPKAAAKPEGEAKSAEEAAKPEGEGSDAKAEAAPEAAKDDANAFGITTREGKLERAKKLDAASVDAYTRGIEQAKELLNDWTQANGRLASIVNDPKVQKCIEDATQLIPWLYDANDQKKEAAETFSHFIAKYPANKKIPACMMRLGVIYTELDQPGDAERVLSDLSNRFKDTPEGKNAKFYLARSLYNNQKFDKSIEIVAEILHNKSLLANLSVQNLRWIASNLWNCGGKKPVNAAKLSLEAADLLLEKLKKPDFKEWVGAQKAVELATGPQKDRDAMTGILKERVLCDAGTAAYWSELYQKAVEYYSEVLKNDKTACFFDAKFGRADAYLKLKDSDSAKSDLSDASLRANTSSRYALYNKAQCEIGDICLDSKDFAKAFASFNIVAMQDTDNSANAQIAAYAKQKTEAEKLEAEKDLKDSVEWIEYAIYKTAFASAKLGKDEDKAKMVAKYKKLFPNGRFTADIDKLPPPEGANKP